MSAEDKQGINAAYYNSVRYLDQNIGALIELLKKHKRYENTMIVYMADHGYCLGHHGRFEKHCGYDPALRVPLMMRWPGRIRQGVVRDLTESVDVPHTILRHARSAGVAGKARAVASPVPGRQDTEFTPHSCILRVPGE